MAPQIKAFATNPDNVLQIPGTTWWKERIDCHMLSSDCHRSGPLTLWNPHLEKHSHTCPCTHRHQNQKLYGGAHCRL